MDRRRDAIGKPLGCGIFVAGKQSSMLASGRKTVFFRATMPCLDARSMRNGIEGSESSDHRIRRARESSRHHVSRTAYVVRLVETVSEDPVLVVDQTIVSRGYGCTSFQRDGC